MADPVDGAASAAANNLSLRDTLSAAFTDEPQGQGVGAPKATIETPVEDTTKTATQEERDERGRFKPKQAATVDDQVTSTDTAVKVETAAEGDQAKPLTPPPGWSPAAKAAFAELPEEVRQSVAKREAEIDRGFAKLKDYKALDSYVEMARQSNTTLPEALERYIAAEQLLERDAVNGLKWLCKNYNIDPRQLLDGAVTTGAVTTTEPNSHGTTLWHQQNQPAPTPQIDLSRYLAPVFQEINSLKQTVVGERQAKTMAEVDAFFSDPKNIYAENVADQMAMLITQARSQGEDISLSQAYDTACWMNPEIRGLLIKKQSHDRAASEAAKLKAAANQARHAGQSITGGPAATPPPAASDPENLRASLERQFAGVRT